MALSEVVGRRFLLAMVELEPRHLLGLLLDQNADVEKKKATLRQQLGAPREKGLDDDEYFLLLVGATDEALLAFLGKRLEDTEQVRIVASAMDSLGIIRQTQPLLEAMVPGFSDYEREINGHLELPQCVETHPRDMSHWDGLMSFEIIVRIKANRWVSLFTDVPGETGDVYKKHAPNLAAKHANLELLEFCHKRQIPWTLQTTEMACQKGNFDCLRFLMDNGCPCDGGATFAAAEAGRIDILKYLRSRDIPWDAGTTEVAAFFGHLHVLRYLHENKCPMDEGATYAAKKNKLDSSCLEYLRSIQCPEVTNPRA